MPQTQTGTTINATISKNANDVYVFSLNDPFNMLISLRNSNGIITIGSKNNDKFNLENSTGLIVNGGNGNNIFNISATTKSLNGNSLRGGTAMDFITLSGSGSTIDLTETVNSGIEAVVSNKRLTGQTVKLSLAQLAGSKLTDGGTGRAFAAVVGSDADVNVVQTGKFKFVGVVDGAGQGFDATGAAVTGDALTTLKASVTSLAPISGNLASLFAGSQTGVIPAKETQVSQKVSAYVFSDGLKSYTVWSDGKVHTETAKGEPVADLFQPVGAAPATPYTFNSVAVFSTEATWAGANISADANGVQRIQNVPGNTEATSAFVLAAGVSGVTLLGDSGANGMNYFGLSASGGGNVVVGSKAGNVFDLGLATALQDQVRGGVGFDVVKAGADGAEVDLTANGAAGKAAASIEAVVGSNVLSRVQTVTLDVNTLRYAADATGAKSAAFVAFLGSDADTLNLTGAGKWVEVATFAPGETRPDHAAALDNTDLLNQLFGASPKKAETALTGHLFEQIDLRGNVVKYMTVYTDATIQSELVAPATLPAAHSDFIV